MTTAPGVDSGVAVALREGAQASLGIAGDCLRVVGAAAVKGVREGGVVEAALEARRAESDEMGAPTKGEGPAGAAEVGVC